MLYKQVKDGKIIMLGESKTLPQGATIISKEKYDSILAVIKNAPQDTLELKFELSDETENYVSRETTQSEKTEWYFNAVMTGVMRLDDVPQSYKAEVEALMPQPEPEGTFEDGYDQAILDLIEQGVL